MDYTVRSGPDGKLELVVLTDAEKKARAKFLRYANLDSQIGETTIPKQQIHDAVAKYFEDAKQRLIAEKVHTVKRP